ncbi:MAG: hypothetical protein QW348_05045 [Ignisphaera sp.]
MGRLKKIVEKYGIEVKYADEVSMSRMCTACIMLPKKMSITLDLP